MTYVIYLVSTGEVLFTRRSLRSALARAHRLGYAFGAGVVAVRAQGERG